MVTNVAFFRQIRDCARAIARLLRMLMVQASQMSWPYRVADDNLMHLSLVVPTYNVAPYLDRFLTSIIEQVKPMGVYEVIIVDDGSTDETPTILAAWQTKYPKLIRVHTQENTGAATARNTGLALAKGTWVGFPDPDDFLHPDYVRQMHRATRKAFVKPLLAIVSNLIFYHEDQDRFADNHPLKYRFQYGKVHKLTDDLGEHVVLSAATCWFHRETVIANKITFDPQVVPAFEDAHFINKLFLSAPNRTVTFVSKAKYFYRKRAAQTSQLDLAKTHLGWFDEQLRFGYLDLLRSAKTRLGYVPRYIQRTCLYPIVWQFRTLLKEPERTTTLSQEQRKTYLRLLDDVFTFIDTETIARFTLARCTEEHTVGLLGRYKNKKRQPKRIYLTNYNPQEGRASFQCYTGGTDSFALQAFVNNSPVSCHDQITINHDLLGQSYIKEHRFWLRLQRGQTLTFTHDDTPCQLWRRSLFLGTRGRLFVMRWALKIAPHAMD